MPFDNSRSCHQLDGKQGAFSDCARDRRNPADSTKLVADIPVPLLPQYPSCVGYAFVFNLLRPYQQSQII